MEPSKLNVKVGIFLSVGLGILLISILVLGTNRSLFKPVISLYAEFESVQGLNVGSVVSLSGIAIGNIEDIRFMREKNKIEIRMSIDQEQSQAIANDSLIEIRTQGALGDKYIYVQPGSATAPTVKDKDYLKVDTTPDLLGVMAKRGNETEKIFDVINNLQIMTNQMVAERRIEKITSNLVTASANFSQASNDAKRVLGELNLKPTVEKLDRILGKIDRGEGSLGGLINDPSVHNSLKSFFGVSNNKKNYLRSLMKTSVEAGEP